MQGRTNYLFEGVNVAKGAVAGHSTTGVCTLVVPELRKSTFLLRIFRFLVPKGRLRPHLIPLGRADCIHEGVLKWQLSFRKVGIPDAALLIHEAKLLINA